MTDHCYIVVEGVIGVGKTTLTRLLQEPFAAQSLLEVVEENPFLSDFYEDRAAYAFQTQTFFLLSRYRQQHDLVPQLLAQSNLISDYLFAKNELFARLTLSGDEWDLFVHLYDILADRIRKPDLVVYLQAGVDTLMTRIALRDRPFERRMDRGYIAALHDAYEQFFTSYTDAPVLSIETDELNVLQDPEALQAVVGQIRAALAGYVQRPLLNGSVL